MNFCLISSRKGATGTCGRGWARAQSPVPPELPSGAQARTGHLRLPSRSWAPERMTSMTLNRSSIRHRLTLPRMALAAAFAVLLSGVANVVQAQGAVLPLVSNVGQAVDGEQNPWRPRLTPRSHSPPGATMRATGYVLTGVELRLDSTVPGGASAPAVTLHSGSATGATVATLRRAVGISTLGNYELAPASSGSLTASTTYWEWPKAAGPVCCGPTLPRTTRTAALRTGGASAMLARPGSGIRPGPSLTSQAASS